MMRPGPALLVLLMLAAGPAAAGCDVAVKPVAFGSIDSMSQARSTGEVVVRCDAATAFSVGISPGRGGSNGRRMDGPGDARLDYGLFADAGYSIPWGDGAAIGGTVPGRADAGTPARLTIYGIIPRQPGLPAGDYADILQVTLSF